MAKLTAKQEALSRKFIGLWHARYGKSPTADIVGVALSLMTGELGLTTEEPNIWPVSSIVPLLRQAAHEVTE